LDYANIFDAFIRAMEIVVILSVALSLIGAFAVIWVRARNQQRERKRLEIETRWRKILTGGRAPANVRCDSDELFTILLVFNEVRRGDAVAKQIGLDAYALRLLEGRDDADKIAALKTLGALRDERAFESASRLMTAPGTELSRAAAHVVLRLRPDQIDLVLLQARDREDWVPSYVEAMLQELGTSILDPAMKRVIEASDERGVLALLGWLQCCGPATIRAIARRYLTTSNDPEIIARCLRLLSGIAQEQDVELARHYARDPAAFVRLSAVRLLQGSHGAFDDLFGELVADPNYWVRQRAAQALAQRSPSFADELAATHADPFARAALTEALAAYRGGLEEAV
jgi:HEAT repeat protein